MKKLLTLLFLTFVVALHAGEIVVDENKSLHDALRQAREWRRTNDARCKGGITIRLMAGRYYMAEPLLIRPEDSGTEQSPTIIVGEDGAVICGDAPQRHTQLWPQTGMLRMLNFNHANRSITIPTPPAQILEKKQLEMVVHQRWAIAILRVKDMKANDDTTVVTFMEPESRIEFEHPWPQPVIDGERGSSSFALRETEQRDGVEQLLAVEGTADTPVSYVTLKNITFENTCWNRPLHKGHVTLQAGFPIIDAYKLQQEGLPWDAALENQAWVERPVSAVSVKHAKHVNFNGCRFQHLAATALDYVDGIEHCTITGNHFSQIGGTAIMIGSFAESPREVHRPYTMLADQCHDITICRNTIQNATTEDWGTVAIGCGYVKNTTICHNTVNHVNYSGICIGWGWTALPTGMQNNHIIENCVNNYARQLYDAGGIYTLSNQPGSSIKNNTIGRPYPAPYATNNRGFCIYLDAKTDGFTIEGNTTEGRSIKKTEIGYNQPGKNLIIKN